MAKIGFAFTASYCTFDKILVQLVLLQEAGHEIFPIASQEVTKVDTRVGKAEDFCNKVEQITGKKIIDTIKDVELFGPKHPLDLVVIAPATGNFIAKFEQGITDNAPLMITKATLRNENPAVIAVSTNDGLSNNGKNILTLYNTKNVFLVPFGQDDPIKKPHSLVAHYDQLGPTIERALEGKQIQPVLKEYTMIKTPK